jgi:transcriptional regulator with XRE-family HTH domain
MQSNNFADKIRTLRKKKGITIRELEQRAGIGHSTIGRWERGMTVPRSQETIKLIADFFNVPVSYFNDTEQEELFKESPLIQNILQRISNLEKAYQTKT